PAARSRHRRCGRRDRQSRRHVHFDGRQAARSARGQRHVEGRRGARSGRLFPSADQLAAACSMTATIAAAFLHHIAAFVVVGALMVELVVLRNDLTIQSARSVLRMDMAYGIAALVLLVVGFTRVFHTEKGAAYYFASGSFLTKLTLFIIV